MEDIDAVFVEARNAFDVVKVAKTLPPGYTEEHDVSDLAKAENLHQDKLPADM